MLKLILGFFFSFIISFFSYRKKSLTLSGFISATFLGTSLYFFGDIRFFVILISFFASSSIITKFKKNLKETPEEITEKSGNRDYTQVISTGIIPLIFTVFYYFTKDISFIIGFVTSVSVANSDTWASEIGVLSKSDPISVISFKRVPRGISGGISVLGLISSFLGSVFISAVFAILFHGESRVFLISFISITGGFLGSLVDSILGASLQAKYISASDKITEKRFSDGKENNLKSGLAFINNNAVNLISSAVVSVSATMIFVNIL
ncbi:MAG: DUF92 domain-containing protein [Thermotogae bacterium]|nr:DUF92 domain-containing protein [Thermotogota bacterium]MCP5465758.1 DUF92 domain-containing protein [Thermotogota bacterium]